MTMRTVAALLAVFFWSAFMAACSSVGGGVDTILSYKEKIDAQAIEGTQMAVDRYCQLMTEDRRTQIREAVNAGRENVIIIDCGGG